MTKIMVTGGAGFIGSHLVDSLVQEGNEVVVIDNLSTGYKRNINSRARFINLDIRDFKALKEMTKGIDVLYHLAALPRIQKSIDNPLLTSEVNIQGTINILESCRQNKVKRVIFTSSSSVYGLSKQLPLKEDQLPLPASPYALQKVVAEEYCKLYSHLYGLDTVILRLFSVYGPRQAGEEKYATAVGKFIYLHEQKKSLPIYGSGMQKRDFTHVSDVINAYMLAKSDILENPQGIIINICAQTPVSILELAKIIGGRKKFYPIRQGEALNNWGCNKKALLLLKWEPKWRIKEYLT